MICSLTDDILFCLYLVATISTLGLVSSVAMDPASFTARLSSMLGVRKPGGYWRLVAMILALLNLKSLPLAWHVCNHNSPNEELCMAGMGDGEAGTLDLTRALYSSG